jgi:hypothetical protein
MTSAGRRHRWPFVDETKGPIKPRGPIIGWSPGRVYPTFVRFGASRGVNVGRSPSVGRTRSFGNRFVTFNRCRAGRRRQGHARSARQSPATLDPAARLRRLGTYGRKAKLRPTRGRTRRLFVDRPPAHGTVSGGRPPYREEKIAARAEPTEGYATLQPENWTRSRSRQARMGQVQKRSPQPTRRRVSEGDPGAFVYSLGIGHLGWHPAINGV